MDKVTAAIYAKTLDALSLRAMITAQNIANVNSKNYQPFKVEFEKALNAAAKVGPAAVNNVEPVISKQVATAQAASSMRLDMELIAASQTAARYTALLNIIGRDMALQRLVIRGGQ